MKTFITANQYDDQAKALTKEYLRSEGELLSLFMEMKTSGAFLELGYSGVYDYCHRRLLLSEAQSYYFKSVAEASVKAPKLKEAVKNGELSLSLARRIAPVITGDNQNYWIDLAKNLPQKELEREVSLLNPKATKPREKIKPVDKTQSHLSVVVSLDAETNLKELQDLLSQKLGRAAHLGEVIEWAINTTREKFSPEAKAKRSKNRNRSVVKEKTVSLGKPKREPIPASVKHEVVKREAYQCQFVSSQGVRCQTKRWLNCHHRTEVSQGGKNTSDNLTFLCSSHHRWIHQRPSVFQKQRAGG